MSRFWLNKSLQQMSDKEWEQLCDGCARCCLLKLEDEDSGELFFTRIACHLLDIEHCRCNAYEQRKQQVPECLQIRQMKPSEYSWLPESCAYRLVSEGRPLPEWHPLISGDKASVQNAGISIDRFAISEEHIHPDQLAEHIIHLPVGEQE